MTWKGAALVTLAATGAAHGATPDATASARKPIEHIWGHGAPRPEPAAIQIAVVPNSTLKDKTAASETPGSRKAEPPSPDSSLAAPHAEPNSAPLAKPPVVAPDAKTLISRLDPSLLAGAPPKTQLAAVPKPPAKPDPNPAINPSPANPTDSTALPVTPAPTPAVAPATAPATPSSEIKRNAQGEPLVTNVFSETDIRQALSDTSSQTGVTLIPDATVQGTVTADLRDVPLETALNILLQAGGFTYAKIDGYYLVGAAEPTNPNFYLLTRMEVVKLKHVAPQTILNLLSGPYGKYLSGEAVAVSTTPGAREQSRRDSSSLTSSVSTFPYPTSFGATNTGSNAPPSLYQVVITAPPRMIDRIKADIARLDQPPTQVMLEAAVLEVSDDALKSLGVDWATKHFKQDLTSGGPNLVYTAVANSEIASLTALVTSGKARLRANPRVATAEGQTAELEVGQDSYFSVVSGPVTYPYTTLQEIQSGIFLRITPRVNEEDHEIVARIEPEVRDVTGVGPNNLPEITFRRASTNMRVRNGDSVVIGGLITDTASRVVNNVPFLSKLPLIGSLFRRSTTRKTQTEVVIIVTPHILDEYGRYPEQPSGAAEQLLGNVPLMP